MQPQVLVPPHGEGSEQQAACSKWVLGGGGGGEVNPPIQLQVINGTAWFLLPRGFPWERQPLWVGRVVVYYSSSSFPGPSPGRGQPHLSITCDITEGSTSAEYRKGSLPQWGESVCIASSSSCIIQLKPTVQPAAFALSILADQGAVSTQSPFLYLPPSLTLLFLL